MSRYIDPRKITIVRLIIVVLSTLPILVLLSALVDSAWVVRAHSGDVFGPACGKAVVDGVVNTVEWSQAVTKTVIMASAVPTKTLKATVGVMNSSNYLHIGITIDDDELTTSGQFLPAGDGFRIDFDNDHGGSLFDLGDDVLIISAGTPQFEDSYIDGNPVPSSSGLDAGSGGTSDGWGAARRISNLNHFETSHPLCSGDTFDFCLQAGDVVGFRLEYLDAEGDGSYGGSFQYPGSTMTDVADIQVGNCQVPDLNTYLPAIMRDS